MHTYHSCTLLLPNNQKSILIPHYVFGIHLAIPSASMKKEEATLSAQGESFTSRRDEQQTKEFEINSNILQLESIDSNFPLFRHRSER